MLGAHYYHQVTEEEITRAQTLAGLLEIPLPHAIGIALIVKRGAVRVSGAAGTIPGDDPPSWCAAQVGWPLADRERLWRSMLSAGHVVAMAGPQQGYSAAFLQYLQAMEMTSQKRSDAGKRGAEARKAKGGYGRAMAGPQPGDGHGIARDGKTETETETSKNPTDGVAGEGATVHQLAQVGDTIPMPGIPDAALPKATRNKPQRDAGEHRPVALLRQRAPEIWRAAGRQHPLVLPMRDGAVDYAREGKLWQQALGRARADGAADDVAAVNEVLRRVEIAARRRKAVRVGEGWGREPEIHALEEIVTASGWGRCGTDPEPDRADRGVRRAECDSASWDDVRQRMGVT